MNRIGLVTGALRDILVPVGALLLFAGTVLSWSASESALEYRNAIELRGIVAGKEVVHADREKNRATRFVIRFTGILPDGQAVETEESLPRESWEQSVVGGEHRVLYLPSERKTVPPAGSAEFLGNILMGVIGVVLACLGGWLLVRPARKVISRLRLLDRGVLATATVTEVGQTSTSINRVILWQLRYRYQDPGGTEHEAASDLLMPDEAYEWQAGSTGPVLYDPVQPATSAWLGRHAAPQDPAAPGFAARVWSKAKTLGRWGINLVVFFALLFLAAVIGEVVPQLKEFDTWMTEQRTPLLFATSGAATLGVFLLIGVVIAMLMNGGDQMDHTDIENQQRSMRDASMGPRAWRMSTYRLFGTGVGASGHDEFSISELKRAAASGEILRDPVWRRRLLAICGGLLMFFGLFGAVIVISPLALKLILAGAVAYALIRMTWACVQA